MKRSGRKSAAQTPAPAKERVYGSKKNPSGSAASKSSASKIKLSSSIAQTLKDKAAKYNKTHKKDVSTSTLAAVMRRGMGAYSKSHRPTITGGAPNSRQAWGFARVNKFLKKKSGEPVKKAYIQDDDLLKDGGELKGIIKAKPITYTRDDFKGDLEITERFQSDWQIERWIKQGRTKEQVDADINFAKKEFELITSRTPFTTWFLEIPKSKYSFEIAGAIYEIKKDVRTVFVEVGWKRLKQNKNYWYVVKINDVQSPFDSHIVPFRQLEVSKTREYDSKERLINSINNYFRSLISKEDISEYPLPNNPDIRYDMGAELPVGRLAKGMTLKDIADHHKLSVTKLEPELKLGIKAEMEHTSDSKVAEAIAYDHLFENPRYYSDLSELEMKAEARKLEDFYANGGQTGQSCKVVDQHGEVLTDRESLEQMTECLENLPQTKSIYFDPQKNDYTPERKKLHRQIILDFKKDLVCVENTNPIAILMGGSPASGKSTFLKKYAPYLLKSEILKVDADEIRAKLPEYEGFNASQTHLETKDIVNTLLSDRSIGIPCRFDVIYDGTMNSTKSYLPLINLLKSLGYKVFIVYIDKVPKDVVIRRSIERYKRSGRFVPLSVIDDFFEKGTEALDKLKGSVDGYMVIDGSDTEYKIIERGGMRLPKNRNYSKIGEPINVQESEIIREFKRGGEIDYENITHKDLVINEEDIKSGLYVIDKKSFSSGKLMLVDKDNRKANFVNHSKTRPRKFGVLRNLSFDTIKDGFYKDLRRSLGEKVVGYDYEKNEWVSDEKNYKRGGEINPDDPKIKSAMTHKAGAAGGLLVGRRHSEGGIKAVNKSTGQPLEMEGGEVVITRDAVSDPTLVEFEGKKMTKRQVLSAINESGGGVAFADGGDIPDKCSCSGKQYNYGGKVTKDLDIVNDIMSSHRKLFGITDRDLLPSEAVKKIFKPFHIKMEEGGEVSSEEGMISIVSKKVLSYKAFSQLNNDLSQVAMKRAYKDFLKSKFDVDFNNLPQSIQVALLLGNQKLVDNFLNS